MRATRLGTPCEGHPLRLVCPLIRVRHSMATMLNSAAVMDTALLLIAANETFPQPQTSDHLATMEIMEIEQVIILQNKTHLIKP